MIAMSLYGLHQYKTAHFSLNAPGNSSIENSERAHQLIKLFISNIKEDTILKVLIVGVDDLGNFHSGDHAIYVSHHSNPEHVLRIFELQQQHLEEIYSYVGFTS